MEHYSLYYFVIKIAMKRITIKYIVGINPPYPPVGARSLREMEWTAY
jgi:hypothetical protein